MSSIPKLDKSFIYAIIPRMTDYKNQGWLGGPLTRAVAVVAFIVVALIGMWGSVKVASAVPNAFSAIAAAVVSITSIFVPAGEEITLSAPSLTDSGSAFTLSWEHAQKSVDGSYTFRYDCAEGVHFTSPATSGAEATVFCNVPFNFLNSENSIVLTAVSANQYADVTVHIDFTPNGAARATVTGTATLTVTNDGSVTETPVIVPTTPTTPVTPTAPVVPKPVTPTKGTETSTTFPVGTTKPASDPQGYVDLAVRVLEVGVVNKTTGAFTASSTPMRNPPGGYVAVRFAVENIGTKTSPQFDFNAVLPTMPSNIFTSPIQAALGPGDRIEFTMGFDKFADADEGVFKVNVDPSSRINEPRKDNNLLTYTVKVAR